VICADGERGKPTRQSRDLIPIRCNLSLKVEIKELQTNQLSINHTAADKSAVHNQTAVDKSAVHNQTAVDK
jgi:hypothetical protein